MRMKINRNALCPCGSGRKYKHCCLSRLDTATPRKKLIAVLVWTAVTGITLFVIVSFIQQARNPGDQREVRRVWSEEHQHWHYAR